MAQDIEEDIPFSEFIKGANNLEKSLSKIANNIDLQDWQAVYKELYAKIPETLRFSSPGDWISFLRQDVRGITQPQFNIQLKGSWIGGHQEPLGFRIGSIKIKASIIIGSKASM